MGDIGLVIHGSATGTSNTTKTTTSSASTTTPTTPPLLPPPTFQDYNRTTPTQLLYTLLFSTHSMDSVSVEISCRCEVRQTSSVVISTDCCRFFVLIACPSKISLGL